MREGDAVFATLVAEPVIHVNGVEHAWRAALTIADLLHQRRDDDANVATAVNGRFVPRHARATTPLAPGDALLVFGAIVGG